MTASMAAEIDRLSRDLGYILRSSTSYASEVPLRIHDRGTDSGHGLGGPKFSAEFLRWVLTGQCSCEERPVGGKHEEGCHRASASHLGKSSHRSHPRRLHQALRRLRAVSPAEFDLAYLILVLGYSWRDALDRINNGRLGHGQDPYTEADFTVLTVAAFSKVSQVY